MLISADQNAPRGLTSASFFGRATIDGQSVTRSCHMASMQWPVPNAWSEIPSPRLLVDVPVSVCGSEFAPITIGPAENKVWEVSAGEKLTIPLVHTRRSEFSGANISLKTYGTGFEKVPAFDAALNADTSAANLDLATLKNASRRLRDCLSMAAPWLKYRYNAKANPRDIVDIVVSTPITIRVKPAVE